MAHIPHIDSFGEESWDRFKDEEIPQARFAQRVKGFVFNTQGIVVQSNKTQYGSGRKNRSFFCTCPCCSPLHVRDRWRITFTLVRPSTWKLSESYSIDNALKHRSEVLNFKSPWFLANYTPFQNYILNIVYKVSLHRPYNDCLPADWNYKRVREDFFRTNTHASITTTGSGDKKANQTVMYASRGVIRYFMENLVQKADTSSYSDLSSFVHHLDTQNPLATVALQADNRSRFYRFFLATPIASSSFLSFVTFPVFVADCAHYKEATYDGHLFVLATKTSYDDVILLAFAIIPSENKEHLYWVMEMCLRHGIPVDKHALFTDEGPLLSTLAYYKRARNMSFFPNICTEHFVRNIFVKVGKPNLNLREELKRIVYEASDAEFYMDYISALQSINSLLLGHYPKNPSTSYVTMDYILNRHPKTWTVFANSQSFQPLTLESGHFLKFQNTYRVLSKVCLTLERDSTVDISDRDYSSMIFKDALCRHAFKRPKFKFLYFSSEPCRRMGFKTTNAAEQMAFACNTSGARKVPPPDTIKILTQKYNEQCRILRDKALNTTASHDGAFLTPPGLLVKSKWSFQQHTEVKEGLPKIISVDQCDHGVIVSLSLPCETDIHKSSMKWHPAGTGSSSSYSIQFSCDRHITTTQMFACPCPCYNTVLVEAKRHCNWPPMFTDLWLEKYMYPEFYDSVNVMCKLVSKDHSVCLDAPSQSQVKNFIHEIHLSPPPKYRVGRANKDARIPSRGEFRKGKRRQGKTPKSSGSWRRRPTSSKRANDLLDIDNQYTDPTDKSLDINGVKAVASLLKGTGNTHVRKNTDITRDIPVEAHSALKGGSYIVLSNDRGVVDGTEDNARFINQEDVAGVDDDDVDAIDDDDVYENQEVDRTLVENTRLIHGPTLRNQPHDIATHLWEVFETIANDSNTNKQDTPVDSIESDSNTNEDTPVDPFMKAFENIASNSNTNEHDIPADLPSEKPYTLVSSSVLAGASEDFDFITHQEYLNGVNSFGSVISSQEYIDHVLGKLSKKPSRSDDGTASSPLTVENTETPLGDGTGDGTASLPLTVENTETPLGDGTGDGTSSLPFTVENAEMPFGQLVQPADICHIMEMLSQMLTEHSADFTQDVIEIKRLFLETKIRSPAQTCHYFNPLMKTLHDKWKWLQTGLVDDFIEILIDTIDNDSVKIYTCQNWRSMFEYITGEGGVSLRVQLMPHLFNKLKSNNDYKLFDQDFVLVPMVDGDINPNSTSSHFFLCIIVPREKTVFMYDSFWSELNSKSCDNPVFRFGKRPEIESFLHTKASFDGVQEPNLKWNFKSFEGAQQINDYDCGVFLSAAITALYQNKDIELSQRLDFVRRLADDAFYITRFRYCVFHSVLSGSLIYPTAIPLKQEPCPKPLQGTSGKGIRGKSGKNNRGKNNRGKNTTLFERIKSCRLPVAGKSNSPEKKGTYFVTVRELKPWLVIHGIRFLSSDGVPDLVDKSLKAIKNYDLVMNTLSASWTGTKEELDMRKESITKMNGFLRNKTATEEAALSTWLKSSNTDLGRKHDGTQCASGKLCFFSCRCISEDSKSQCTQCGSPVHGTVCLDSPHGVCLSCMKKEVAPSVTSSPVATKHAREDKDKGAISSDGGTKTPFKNASSATGVTPSPAAQKADRIDVYDNTKGNADADVCDDYADSDDDILNCGNSPINKKTSIKDLRRIVDDAKERNQDRLAVERPSSPCSSLSISCEPSPPPFSSPSSSCCSRNSGTVSICATDVWVESSPPISTGMNEEIDVAVDEYDDPVDEDDDSKCSGCTTSSERRRRYDKRQDTLKVGDCIWFEKHDWRHNSPRCTITGWYCEGDRYRPFVEHNDPFQVTIFQPAPNDIIYKDESEVEDYRAGKKCSDYDMNVNIEVDDIEYVEPGKEHDDLLTRGKSILTGTYNRCPVIDSNQADNTNSRSTLSNHFEKRSRCRIQKLIDMLNTKCMTKRNAAAKLLGGSVVVAQISGDNVRKAGTLRCTNCRVTFETNECSHYYTCKCKFHHDKHTYCSLCLNDAGDINKVRTREVGDKALTRGNKRTRKRTKKYKDYIESKKRKLGSTSI